MLTSAARDELDIRSSSCLDGRTSPEGSYLRPAVPPVRILRRILMRTMKVVILAGGLGTRLSEETAFRPKPMVEIGGRPLLWHLMKIFSAHRLTDFIGCLGYRGFMIKEYFSKYPLH